MASLLVQKLPIFFKHNKVVFLIRHAAKRVEFRSYVTEEEEERIEPANADQRVSDVKVLLGNRGNLTISTGKLAKLADGCALVTYRNTTVMATVVSKEKGKDAATFTPLTVFYQQKAAALGRIPVNYLRREIGQNEHEILVSRLIDRSIRPLFPEGFNWETQIICSPLAIDGNNFPDVLGINAASAALAISDIPWEGPIGAVRVGLIDGEVIINPTKLELKKSELNILIATRESKMVTMIDGTASNVCQSNLLKCIKTGVKECQKVVSGVQYLRNLVGKKKRIFEKPPIDPVFKSKVESLCADRLRNIFLNHKHNKQSRDEEISALQNEVLEIIRKDYPPENVAWAVEVFWNVCKNVFRDLIFETQIRCDGRRLRELREINCEVDLYEPLHGSALFQRGQTQVLCTVALDSPNSALKMDKMYQLTSGLKEKNFFVHYEFPPFAVKETGRLGPIGRREIGHGALAEKALQSNIPENYPFTIRLTSEVLESNGSSSMATVCGGTLALMDAGIPILNACAGVAMGFISKCDENNEITDYRILTDLLGIEDHFGEIDFKIAGTKKAYTAFQLDVKNSGIPLKIIFEILGQAKDSISEILQIMKKACSQVRPKMKDNCPQMQKVKVPVHLRSQFLGPGGINIKKLEAATGVELSEEVAGEFTVFAANKDAMKEADEMIAEFLKSTEEPQLEFGGVYKAVITEIRETGCMVTLHPNMKPVHLHLSQLDFRKISHPSALGLVVGQEIRVKYFGRDPVSGTMRLSRKVLMGPSSEVVQSFLKKPHTENTEESKALKTEATENEL